MQYVEQYVLTCVEDWIYLGIKWIDTSVIFMMILFIKQKKSHEGQNLTPFPPVHTASSFSSFVSFVFWLELKLLQIVKEYAVVMHILFIIVNCG